MEKKQKLDPIDRKDEELQDDRIPGTVAAHKTSTVVDNSHQLMTGLGNNKPLIEFIELSITRPDGECQPIQYKIAGHLLSNGVDPKNLQAAALVHTAMLSSRLGYPISAMLVSEDPRVAVQLLEHCKKMAPGDSIIEFQEFKPAYLYINKGKELIGKSIICPKVNGFRKAHCDLEQLLTCGHTLRQELEKGRYEVGLSEYRTEMQLSAIGIDSGKPGEGLCHPSILKIPISLGRSATGQNSPESIEKYDLGQSPLFKIRKSFHRLTPRPVTIPYEDQLRNAMIKSDGGDDVKEKFETLKKVISVCAIINQPPPLRLAEWGACLYGTDEQEVSRWLTDVGIEKASEKSLKDPIVATKVDYYLARLQLDGILMTGHTHFTDRQQKVFEEVKTINLGKMGNLVTDNGGDVEKLAIISRGSQHWASREKVFEMINKNGGNYPLSTVNNDLVALLGMGVLERAKPQKSRFYGYYIVTMALSKAIKLPDPETIQDPVYEGKSVSVVNPLTGEVEEI
jgi:hypothetical protein